MADQIRTNAPLLRTFDACIKTGLDESEAAEFTASEHDVSEDHVMSVIYARESAGLAMEMAG